MYVIVLSNLLACILASCLQPSVASASAVLEAEIPGEAVSLLLQKDDTAAGQKHNASGPQESECTLTYPSRLIYYRNEASESTYHDLNTHARIPDPHGQEVHLAQASFQLQAFGSQFILDLTLNNDLLSSDYVEIHYENGKPILWKGGEHCYYHGQIRGNDNSRAALSTCNGLHGMFDDGVHVYIIEPLKQNHSMEGTARPHVLRRTTILQQTPSAGEEGMEEDLSWLRRRKKRAMPRNVFEEMKYIELMIVVDHSMVWKIFKEHLNTRVVLVAVEIWTDKDHIPVSVIPFEMLRNFSKYRQQHIRQHADAVHLFSNVTFHYARSSLAYFGGVCSVSHGVGIIEFGSTWTMAPLLAQSLAQNLGIQWDSALKRKDCGCMNSWLGCIMEDTGVQHPRTFSKCSITDFKEFLLKGGGSCLFNKPSKLFEDTECGNGYVEVGEECDCGPREFYPRGYSCRYAVNDCDISEMCSGDSGLCPLNLHKQDGYFCSLNQGRCYAGECKTRDSQCKYVWGPKAASSEKFCYEKLNTEGSEKGNCGQDGDKWIQCSKHDVFCGYLLCTNTGRIPRIGTIKGEVTPTNFNHQGRLIDCSGGHVLLDDQTDLGYVEDGTPCGPSMMCLDRKCLPLQYLNLSSCPTGPNEHVCSSHGVCNNEAACTCDTTWAGTDCSMPDPPKEPPPAEDEGPKGPSATNLIIGSIAGAILVTAIVLGGTGWGFKNVKRRGYDPSASAI
ncbi:disintegrin and metalloproteinase domain-containing protein 23-like [Sinocyclocheilus rhinocerous]|uniref:disintegrin and metalloproteinase domain-containing protein 23-like n=1 Tax=Sinocyclocheilus rhinocerous TaxID=307959 RepID=UPI0007BA32C0|nr:PREDICTED: disintegrin and metalloproteinase domain-containing protein 23-like [Sinocyclocheilus rhinocerous]